MEENNFALPSALDSLSRNDFESDTAYLEAAADLELKRSTPEFQKAYIKTKIQYMERKAEEDRKEAAKQFEQEVGRTRLNENEDKQIREKSAIEVADAVRRGEIDPADMETEINKKYQAHYNQAKRTKASHNLANRTLREAMGYHIGE